MNKRPNYLLQGACALALCALAPLTLHAIPVSVNGVFDNPSPIRNATNPYRLMANSHYAGLGTSRINMGVPNDYRPTPSSPGGVAYDSNNHIYESYEGNLITKGDVTYYVPSDAAFASGSAYPLSDPGTLRNFGTWVEFASLGAEVAVAAKGDSFVLGTLTFRNGATINGDLTFDLLLDTTSAIADFNQSASLRMAVDSTLNEGDSLANADYFYFPDYLEYGSFRVPEGEVASIQILGSFGSLHFDGFGELVAGNGFLNGSTTDKLAVPDAGSSALLLALGVGPLMVARRRLATR